MLIRGYVNINREGQIHYTAKQCNILLNGRAGYGITAKKKSVTIFGIGATSIIVSQRISFHLLYIPIVTYVTLDLSNSMLQYITYSMV
jgi:hypothetical protein